MNDKSEQSQGLEDSLAEGIAAVMAASDELDQPEDMADLFLEELNRIRDERPSAREVEDAKTYLLGSRLLQFGTNAGIASQLLAIERYKLGLGYLEDFKKAVSAVTPEDVQAMAKKYLDPKRMILVAAGAIDSDGRPLKEKD